MGTTGQVIHELIDGVRDSTGAAIASGNARFFNTGTLAAATVYSDAACTTAHTQPIVLDAGGRKVGPQVWAKTPVRMRVHDSLDSTLMLDVDPVNVVRAEQVYLTVPGINAGNETDLNTMLANNNLISYSQSAGATARSYASWLSETHVSVKDFNAAGDGATDDTAAIQAAIDEVKALGGGWVFVPAGTFKITGALVINAAGVKITGAGIGVAVIKNFGTTTDALQCTYTTGGVVSGLVIEHVSITANTSSTGKAISISNAKRATVRDVYLSGHGVGVYEIATGTAFIARNVFERVTGDACANGAIVLDTGSSSSGSIIRECTGLTNGGIYTSQADTLIEGCYVKGSGDSFQLSAARCKAVNCVSDGTGGIAFNVTGSSCTVAFCSDRAGGTKSLDVPNTVTDFADISNNWTATVSDLSTTGNQPFARINKSGTSSGSANFTATPAWTAGAGRVLQWEIVASGAAGTVTIAAPSSAAADLPKGAIVAVVITKLNAGDATLNWNAVYLGADGSTISAPATVVSGTTVTVIFRKDVTNYIAQLVSAAVAP